MGLREDERDLREDEGRVQTSLVLWGRYNLRVTKTLRKSGNLIQAPYYAFFSEG